MESFSAHKKSEKGMDLLTWILIFGCLVFRLYILYFPFKLYGYLVPPGQDAINHLSLIKNIMQGNYDFSYPPFFHWIISLIAQFSSMDPLRILKWLTPAMVALPSIAVFLFLKKNFGRFTAVVGFLIALMATNYGLIAFADGNYPNILAGGLFLPVALAYLAASSRSKKLSNYVVVIILAILMVLTHHLTAAIFILILFCYSLLLLIWNKKEEIAPGLRKLAIFSFVVVAIVLVAVFATSLRDFFLPFLKQIISGQSLVRGSAFIRPVEYWQYGEVIGSLVWSGGLISLFYLIYMLGKKGQQNKAAILLILVWFVLLFVLSRISVSGLQGRFARELGLPLILAMAITIRELFSNFNIKMQKIIGYGLLGLIIVFNLSQINDESFSSPKFFNSMIWFDRYDLEKAKYIENISEPDDIIFSNRTSPYLPYFADRNIDFNIEAKLADLPGYAETKGAKYLFIGQKTRANPDSKSYPFYKGFEEIRENLMNIAKQNKLELVHKFADGSLLYKF